MSQVALAEGHAREYETIYILRPNVDKEKADDVANRVADAITTKEGILTEAELWGSRRLSYPIKRHHRGTYVYVKYLGRGGTVAEIERQLRLVDSVIRFQTIVLRSQVKVGDQSGSDKLELDFNLPFEADEPELSMERALGLDAPFIDTRRRRDRDAPPREPPPEAPAEGASTEAAAEGAAPAAAPDADAKPAEKAPDKAPDKAPEKAPAEDKKPADEGGES